MNFLLHFHYTNTSVQIKSKEFSFMPVLYLIFLFLLWPTIVWSSIMHLFFFKVHWYYTGTHIIEEYIKQYNPSIVPMNNLKCSQSCGMFWFILDLRKSQGQYIRFPWIDGIAYKCITLWLNYMFNSGCVSDIYNQFWIFLYIIFTES